MPGLINRARRRAALAGLSLLGVVVLGGCGGPIDPYQRVKISGSVKYEDGSLIPADRIRVQFISHAEPINKRTKPRPGEAEVNVADGTFDTATTHRFGDGVIPGKHTVLIVAIGADEQPEPSVPDKYRDPALTPFQDVDTQDAPFHFTIKKP